MVLGKNFRVRANVVKYFFNVGRPMVDGGFACFAWCTVFHSTKCVKKTLFRFFDAFFNSTKIHLFRCGQTLQVVEHEEDVVRGLHST